MRKLTLATLFMAALQGAVFGQVPGAAPQTNLLKNNSFEKGAAGWDLHSYGEKAKATKDPKQAHDGHLSIRIDQPGPSDTGFEQSVTVKANTRYRLSGWIKTENIVKPEGPKQRTGGAGASLSVAGPMTRRRTWLARAIGRRSPWISRARTRLP